MLTRNNGNNDDDNDDDDDDNNNDDNNDDNVDDDDAGKFIFLRMQRFFSMRWPGTAPVENSETKNLEFG